MVNRRKRELILVLSLICFIGCQEGGRFQSPTAPPPPTDQPKGSLWGQVFEGDSAICLLGAVVEIVGGANVGQKDVQDEECTYWDGGGWEFKDLPLGVPIRIRATKPGYRPEEREVMAVTHGEGITISLVRE